MAPTAAQHSQFSGIKGLTENNFIASPIIFDLTCSLQARLSAEHADLSALTSLSVELVATNNWYFRPPITASLPYIL